MAAPRKPIPAEYADRLLLALQDAGALNNVIILETEHARPPDGERLRRALALVVEAHPILGCRLVRHPGRPYWEPVGAGEGGDPFVATSDPGAYEAFTLEPQDPCRGPQVRVCVLGEGGGARIALRVAHTLCDAGGTKELSGLLSSTYAHLAVEPGYRPPPGGGSRSGRQVVRRLPLRAWPVACMSFLRVVRTGFFPHETHSLRLPRGERTPLARLARDLPAGRVAALAGKGRAAGATVNDILLAAFYRALVAAEPWDGRSGLRAQMTVDMRRYLPSGRGDELCNLSSFEYPFIVRDPGGGFDGTLAAVRGITRRIKRGHPGLAFMLTAPFLGMLSYDGVVRFCRSYAEDDRKAANFAPGLTNMGPIPPACVEFDGRRAAAARLLMPPAYPPTICLGVSGYEGSVTISAAVPRHVEGRIGSLLDGITGELERWMEAAR